MSKLNDDRPDVKQASIENTSDFEAMSKALGKFGATLREALGETIKAINKAITPKFILVVLKHNYAMTPKWRFIRRYQLRRKIKEVEALVELDAVTFTPKQDA